MKTALLFAAMAFTVTETSAQWTSYGPYIYHNENGLNITCLAISGTNIFAASYNGVFLSGNNGNTWTQVNTGLTDTTINTLAISGSNIFAGTAYSGGIFLSTNNGDNWSVVDSGLPVLTVYEGRKHYDIINALAISGSDIFAGTQSSGIFLSTNNGATWNAVNNGLDTLNNGQYINVSSLAVNGSQIFAGTGYGVYLSSNGGDSWTKMNNGLSDSSVITLGINGSQIFAGTYYCHVFSSADNGGSWTNVSTGLPPSTSSNQMGFAFSGSTIYAGTNYGLYFSTDNAASWSPAGLNSIKVASLAISDSTLFAGTNTDYDTGGVWQISLNDIATGIGQIPTGPAMSFTLNPNPSSSIFIIETTGTGSQQLQLFDLTGQLLLTQTIQNSKTTIDASGLTAGVYLVSLKGSEGVSTEKLVVAK